jgi:hypothetical protein
MHAGWLQRCFCRTTFWSTMVMFTQQELSPHSFWMHWHHHFNDNVVEGATRVQHKQIERKRGLQNLTDPSRKFK